MGCGQCQKCSCKDRDGGPTRSKEACKDCGVEFECHRAGSWDWKPKSCPECVANRFVSHVTGEKE